ncbi:30S ribosomal protein S6 [Candidatus Uhrbacteria bacterium]|nr:30S ribosomal protein S6 [Candidatus Uhrbacteria bacterium]
MEKYELMYILPAKHTEEELKVLSDKIRGIVTDLGGEVAEEHNMGKRKLAYPIKHVRYGHYYLLIANMEQGAVAKLNSTLRLTTELLRHLIIRRDPHIIGVPKLREEEQIVRKDRTERDRGPRRRTGPERSADPSDAGTGAVSESPERKVEKKVDTDELDERLEKILKDDVL